MQASEETTGDGSSSGWGAVSTCSRWRIRVVMASSTVAVRRGADRSGAASTVWAACRALRRSTRSPTVGSDPSASSCVVLDSAASSWVRRRRQGLQIGGMGKSCPQPGFIVPQLALSDLQVASRLVALRSRAADQPFDRVEDGARAVHVPGEWGRPPEGALDIHLRGALRMLYQAKAQAASTDPEATRVRLIHQRWQRVQAGGQRLQGVVPAVRLRPDGDRISRHAPRRWRCPA